MPHAQVLTIQNHYDDSSLKLERWIGEKKNPCKVHIVCASCLSRFLACISFTAQHVFPLKTTSKQFHFSVSVSLFPNEEDTVPSGKPVGFFQM